MPFKAYQNTEKKGQIQGSITNLTLEDLSPGEVVIKVHYSSINYKDALGATGKGKIFRTLPIIGGIDLAGEVISSEDPTFTKGELVLATGCNLGEVVDGGYSEYARVNKNSVVKIPLGLSTKESMILGTAGLTAALCIERMENNGQTTDKGPIVITGASGGVGSFATSLLSGLDYEIIAVTGKEYAHDYLKKCGALQITSPTKLDLGKKPLEKTRYGGVIDNVGGELLTQLIPHVNLWGNIASVGLAGGSHINTTVMPFILRGVSLLGISSNNCDYSLRVKLWQKLASTYKPLHLSQMIEQEITLEELPASFQRLIDRKVVGRILVKINP